MENSKDKRETETPPIKAVIFDLDGLLIDSEGLWTEGRNIILRDLKHVLKVYADGKTTKYKNYFNW